MPHGTAGYAHLPSKHTMAETQPLRPVLPSEEGKQANDIAHDTARELAKAIARSTNPPHMAGLVDAGNAMNKRTLAAEVLFPGGHEDRPDLGRSD